MENAEFRRYAYMMLALIAGLIDGQAADNADLPSQDEIPELLDVAKNHSLRAITAAALQARGLQHPDIKEAYAKAVRKSVLNDVEYAAVCSALIDARIHYLPLKGITLKSMYPKDWMREMGDIDILTEPGSHEAVRDIMLSRGYTVKYFDKNNEDLYKKQSLYVYEIHRTLFDAKSFPELQAYFDGREYKPSDDEPYRLQMDLSDVYVYLIVHLYMHYTSSGTGLRSLLDIRLFLSRFDEELDRYYIEAELEKLGLTDFEEHTRILARRFLQPGDMSEQERGELDYYIFSGTYGTKRQFFRNSIAKSSGDSPHFKLKYIKSRFVVPDSFIEKRPFYQKHPRLRFVLGTERFFKAVFKKPKKLKLEIEELVNAKRPPRS